MKTMKKILTDFLYKEEIGLGKSQETLKTYRTDILQFIKYISEYEEVKEFNQVNKMSFRSFMAYLNRQKLTKRTINRKLSNIRTFFKYLSAKKIIEANYSKLVTSPKFEKKLPTVLTSKEIKILTETIDTKKLIGIRDRAMIELLYSSGMRASELLSLSEYLINFNEREIRVVGKGEKERIVFFSKTAREWILKYIEEKKKQYKNYTRDILFVNSKGGELNPRSLRRIITNYSKKINIGKEITVHTFRHSFATYLLNEGVDIKYVQELLGHKSLSTTQIYTRVSKSFLKEVYLRTHPFNVTNNKD